MSKHAQRTPKNTHSLSVTVDNSPRRANLASVPSFVDNRAQHAEHTSLQSAADASPQIAQLSRLQHMASAAANNEAYAFVEPVAHGQSVAQLMKWPKKAPNVSGSKWDGQDVEDIKDLYEWCQTKTQFNKIIDTLTYDQWFDVSGHIKDSNWAEFDSEIASVNNTESMLSLFAYFKVKNSKQRVLQEYDMSTYVFPSEKAKALVLEAGMTLQDLDRLDLKVDVGLVELHDREYSKLAWEKHANSEVLTPQERPLKNQAIESVRLEMVEAIKELLKTKNTKDKELAAIQLHNDNVADVLTKAATLPSFGGVTGNPLAKKIWEASVAMAGHSGYLEVDTTIHAKNTIIAATALLRTFSQAWDAKYNTSAYMVNPHCPGGGRPSDKTGHSNQDSRTSLKQANFIATWGGTDTVIHINSDSI